MVRLVLRVLVRAFCGVAGNAEAGSPAPSPARGPVAGPLVLDHEPITGDDIEIARLGLPSGLREGLDSPDGRRKLAGSIAYRRLLAAEARRRGIDQEPRIRSLLKDEEDRRLAKVLVDSVETALAPPSESELLAYYDTNPQRFALPERVRVERLHVVLPANASEVERARARALAESLLARLRAGVSIDQVVADEARHHVQAEDSGFILRNQADDRELVQAAFSVSIGQLSPVVACRDGFAIVRPLERREAGIAPSTRCDASSKRRCRRFASAGRSTICWASPAKRLASSIRCEKGNGRAHEATCRSGLVGSPGEPRLLRGKRARLRRHREAGRDVLLHWDGRQQLAGDGELRPKCLRK